MCSSTGRIRTFLNLNEPKIQAHLGIILSIIFEVSRERTKTVFKL